MLSPDAAQHLFPPALICPLDHDNKPSRTKIHLLVILHHWKFHLDMSGHVDSVDINGVRQDTFHCGPWTIVACKSHILHSMCSAPVVCQKPESTQKCLFCQFQKELDLPAFPDMTFPRNKLSVTHKSGFSIEFTCLEALKMVLKQVAGDLEVGVAEAWKEARNECEYSKRVIRKFDWTFCTEYKGTISNQLQIEPTDERIDMEKLKEKTEIAYYDSIELFEDELADHGVSQLNVKIVSCWLQLTVRITKMYLITTARHERRPLHPLALLFKGWPEESAGPRYKIIPWGEWSLIFISWLISWWTEWQKLLFTRIYRSGRWSECQTIWRRNPDRSGQNGTTSYADCIWVPQDCISYWTDLIHN